MPAATCQARARAASEPIAMRQASERAALRELVTLAWPIAAAMCGETLLGLVDTKLVGGLGADALGGVGVATTFMFLAYAMVWGIMRGVKVRVSHAIGAAEGASEGAASSEGALANGVRYAQAGVAIGAALGVLVAVAGRDVSPLLRFARIDAALVPHARDFFAAVTLGAPATAVVAALVQHRQALGDARSPMIVGVSGNVFNALFAYGLIYGHFGLPALGVRGGGLATAATEWLEAFALLALLARDALAHRGATLGLRAALGEVLSLGVPTGLHFVGELLAFTLFTVLIGGLGATEIAAHQLALATIRTSFLPGLAISEAACVMVGRAIGAKRLPDADRATHAALKLAAGFMAACGVVFAVLGGAIARAFTDDAAVAATAQRLLWVAAVFQVLDAVNIVLRGALRGAKDVRFAAVLGTGIVWTCVPTAAFVLGKVAGMGALGGWLGFIAETTFGAALFWWRWRRGAWRAAAA